MKIFIFGKDKKLSRIELTTFLNTLGVTYEIKSDSLEYLMVDIENEEEINYEKIIKNIGGTIRIIDYIGKKTSIYDSIFEDFETFLPKKYNYALSSIGLTKEEKENIQLHLKANAREQNSKGIFKNPNSDIIDPKNFFSWKLGNDEGLELFCIKDNDEYIYGKAIASTDPRVYKDRDEGRPSRFFTHGTSIRTAQIMVNLLGMNLGETIVDPFCGTGTFLIEGMLKGLNVIGIDNDPELINSSKENIHWAKNAYDLENEAEVILGSSTNTQFEADAAVFEPYMGPFLKSEPNKANALKIKEELDELYFETFKNLKRCLRDNGKVVCILPDFKTNNGEIIKINRSVLNGFEKVHEIPYESAGGSKILRNIYILTIKNG